MYFNSVEDTVSAISYLDLHPLRLSLLPTFSRETLDSAKGMCVGSAATEEEGARGGIRLGTEAFSSARHFIP